MKNENIIRNEKYFTRVSGALVLVIVTGETTIKNRRLWTIERVIGLGAPPGKPFPKLDPRNASALHETRNPTEEIRRRREVSKTEVPKEEPDCICSIPSCGVDTEASNCRACRCRIPGMSIAREARK